MGCPLFAHAVRTCLTPLSAACYDEPTSRPTPSVRTAQSVTFFHFQRGVEAIWASIRRLRAEEDGLNYGSGSSIE